MHECVVTDSLHRFVSQQGMDHLANLGGDIPDAISFSQQRYIEKVKLVHGKNEENDWDELT